MLLIAIVGVAVVLAGGVIVFYAGTSRTANARTWLTVLGFAISAIGLAMIAVPLANHISSQEAKQTAQIRWLLQAEYRDLKDARPTHNAAYIKFPGCEPGVAVEHGKLAFEFNSDVESPSACRRRLAAAHVKP